MNTSTPAIQPLKGWITTNYQTYRGKKLGPYYVRTWFENGKRKKQYVKPGDLNRVRAACQAHREGKKNGTRIARDLNNTLGNINWLNRMAKRIESKPLKPEETAFVAQIQQRGIAVVGRPRLRQTTTHNLHPKTFMDHFFANAPASFWKRTKQDAQHIADEIFGQEDDEQRWQRWRETLAQLPKPRPLPSITPPSWIRADEIDAAVDDLLQSIKHRDEI